MTKQLIIRLSGQANGNIPWLLWCSEAADSSGTVESRGVLDHAGQLSELTELSRGAQVKVLVSSTEIGFHVLDLPPGSKRHLAQVVPYALEEELAQDIQELHFAWQVNAWRSHGRSGSSAIEPGLPVVVVAKQQMRDWQSWLDDAGIRYTALIPDLYILPLADDEWSAMSLDDDIIVRHSTWRGFAIEQSLFAELSGLFSDALQPPARIRCWGNVEWPQAPAELSHAATDEPATADTSREEQPAGSLEESNLALELARGTDFSQAINLLQGDFAVKKKRKASLGVWRYPAIAAGFLLALLFVDKGVYIWQLNQEYMQVNQAIEQRYRETFPNETRIVNVRAQLNQHLNRLQSGGESSQLLGMLNQLAGALDATDMEITLMQFDAGRDELRIQATAADFATFERFRQIAGEAQLDVEQGQLNSRAGRIAGTLVVRGGRS